jgi:hypothetical protein
MLKSAIAVFLMLSGIANAQSTIVPTGTGVNVSAPTAASGRSTENLSVTNGSRTSLSVGNSTSFGASTNLSASEGLTAVSRSVLAPSAVAITSTIGSNPTALGLTKINISNLTAKGGGTIIPGDQGGIGSGTTINSTDGQFASGDATIDGMGASVTMNIGSTPAVSGTSTGSEASFFAIVHPNVTGTTACNPTNTQACTYTNLNGLVSGNAAASANLSTQTNIDIQANSFTQTFAQSF